MKNIVYLAILAITFTACGGNEGNLVDTSLLAYKIPINIMAPAKANISQVGDFLTIEKDSTYNLEIIADNTNSLNLSDLVSAAKEMAKEDPFFKEYVKEDEAGFIFKINVDGIESYDFRYIRLVGAIKYTFRPTPSVFHTEKNVNMMYKAVQGK